MEVLSGLVNSIGSKMIDCRSPLGDCCIPDVPCMPTTSTGAATTAATASSEQEYCDHLYSNAACAAACGVEVNSTEYTYMTVDNSKFIRPRPNEKRCFLVVDEDPLNASTQSCCNSSDPPDDVSSSLVLTLRAATSLTALTLLIG